MSLEATSLETAVNTVETANTARPLDGKVALVTGGSRGIGAAVALRLAEDGADVAITYQHGVEPAAEIVAKITAMGRRATAVRAEAADATAVREAVETVVAELGRLDILVNNAGTGAMGPIGELSLEDVDRVLAVNVRGSFLAAQAAVAHLGEGGRIVTIGSCIAERVAFPGGTLYATSKAALTGLTKALARELGPQGITANIVHPGPIDTDMNPADGPFAAGQAAFTAVGRYGRPEEVADTVAHLVGPSGAYITGASVAVDGGLTA
ncbi:3-oxoacyl-ACP reductase family protein [Streptomyces netropsis]|uniref:NAD(P)-dependent dehydrogenase (Short-subunit alcohol dehydrogenase family) n=1 Tax=Streptomyces netropsis TaxID=55404 RepID=A0A7W7LA99_STRNE|nr:3-oxoacyl-ACP reductase family protein [Streptomyces netropsis]MBB4885961.1 NAD(P)-dependent dehydrogenase (short-subunit alcohol dehydrogenase family) [Streptomyces netropsis]